MSASACANHTNVEAVVEFGLHPLLCRLSAGQFPQQAVLVRHQGESPDVAGFSPQLEPTDFDRSDGNDVKALVAISSKMDDLVKDPLDKIVISTRDLNSKQKTS
ncbi:Hypothetical predicted protein [Octopus vulgaris]|uniref:Uncharacterized protein n=1 Tax=Octopus vulgaris TaxID=6645 RepID=A0AA36FG87_OCTVU|nr:Hypothetical predicted protein [Octopus vulgaris]